MDNTSVCEECVMMCTELQYEDADKDVVVYGDQGINTEEYEKDMYGDLMKTQSEEEEVVKYNGAQSANDSVVLERKRRRLNKIIPNENAHDVSQSDTSLNENCTENSFKNVTTMAQGQTDIDDEIEQRKSWTMEMLMNDGNISTSTTNKPEQMSEEDKKFLYARAVH